MKLRHLIAVLIFPLLLSAAHAADGKHLFILSGQSNMAGLKPELSFTPTVQDAFGEDNVIVVKRAKSGQPIRRWYKDWTKADGTGGSLGYGDIYNEMMILVNQAIEGQQIATVTFVWMQGERDAKDFNGEVYGASFMGIIRQLEQDLGRNDINFVIGRLSDADMDNSFYGHWTLVRDEQVKVGEASPRGVWTNTDDIQMGSDNLHYSNGGYITLGRRFASKAIHLIQKHHTE